MVLATLPKHKIADKHLRLNLNPGTWVKVIVPWLRLVLAIGGFKGRTSLARLVINCYSFIEVSGGAKMVAN